jgi:hypothetical protein
MKLIKTQKGYKLSYLTNEKNKVYGMIQRRKDRQYTIDREIRAAKRKVAELCALRDFELDNEIASLEKFARKFEQEEKAAHPEEG